VSIERFRKLIPAPQTKPTIGDWKGVEKKLGVELPADYKQFIEQYGAGNLGDFIHIWSPFAKNPGSELLVQSKKEVDALKGLKHTKIPYPIHPAKKGLLPWGRTDNSDILMWRTDNWHVVVTDSSDFNDTEASFTDFLSTFIEGADKYPFFPDDVPTTKKFFPAQ